MRKHWPTITFALEKLLMVLLIGCDSQETRGIYILLQTPIYIKYLSYIIIIRISSIFYTKYYILQIFIYKNKFYKILLISISIGNKVTCGNISRHKMLTSLYLKFEQNNHTSSYEILQIFSLSMTQLLYPMKCLRACTLIIIKSVPKYLLCIIIFQGHANLRS